MQTQRRGVVASVVAFVCSLFVGHTGETALVHLPRAGTAELIGKVGTALTGAGAANLRPDCALAAEAGFWIVAAFAGGDELLRRNFGKVAVAATDGVINVKIIGGVAGMLPGVRISLSYMA